MACAHHISAKMSILQFYLQIKIKQLSSIIKWNVKTNRNERLTAGVRSLDNSAAQRCSSR